MVEFAVINVFPDTTDIQIASRVIVVTLDQYQLYVTRQEHVLVCQILPPGLVQNVVPDIIIILNVYVSL